ncbi:MAG: NAD(P)-dependent alcohol dehydrogenase [Pseudomonadota bacterium]
MTEAHPTMQALTYERYGPPGNVRIAEVPKPATKPDEILIQVHASAVNTSDWRIRAAAFPGITALPARMIFGLFRPRNIRLGSEFAGVVEAVGRDVTRFEPGQRVFGISSTGGASAEYLALDETDAIAEMPEHLSFIEAAALPFGGLAALVFLRDFAALKAKQRVLIVGASGGVGIYAVQIAKSFGAHVTGLSGPDSQTLVSTLGADVTLNYKTVALSEIGDRFDVILDTVGVVSPSQARRLLRRSGLFLPLNIGLRESVASLLNAFFSTKTCLAVSPNTSEDLHQLGKLVRGGHVQPVIDTVYELTEASLAHAHVETRHRKGAIVLSVLPDEPATTAVAAFG